VPSAAREAAFRAKHGMSSGAYYEMRRKAARGGIEPSNFDKLARHLPGYKQAKRLVQLKRAAGKIKAAGGDTQPVINQLKDEMSDLPEGIEVGWGTP